MEVRVKDSNAVIAGLSFRQAKRLVDSGQCVAKCLFVRFGANAAKPEWAGGFTAGQVAAAPQHLPVADALAIVAAGYAEIVPPDAVPAHLRKPQRVPRLDDQPAAGPAEPAPAFDGDDIEDLESD